ncbi:MAG: metallophosphoesterase [Myxococcaceae bacterium]|nr:metallophosphoesterase [Myxococcaceae bacterium]
MTTDVKPPAPADDAPALSGVPLRYLLRGIAFFTLVVGLLGLFHRYIGLRVLRDAQWNPVVVELGWGVLWLGFFSIFAAFLAGRLMPRRLALGVHWAAFMWLGCFAVLLPFTAFADIGVWGLSRAISTSVAWGRWESIAILATSALALVFAFRTARGTLRVERRDIAIDNLPEAFEGFRIAQITDVHIGETLDGQFLTRVVQSVNDLNADMVAVTGDLVDGAVSKIADEVAPLQGLQAKEGAFYITGNHEYYHGGPEWESYVASLGLHVLHNTHRVIHRQGAALTVAGVTDLEGRNRGPSHAPDIEAALENAPPHAPKILLAHQPLFARYAQNKGISLQLSGHTHGGQIFPFMFFVKLQQPVVSGYKVIGDVPTYTSRGTGYWGPPFRLGAAPEITLLTLRRK